jgi:hypothetical protein
MTTAPGAWFSVAQRRRYLWARTKETIRPSPSSLSCPAAGVCGADRGARFPGELVYPTGEAGHDGEPGGLLQQGRSVETSGPFCRGLPGRRVGAESPWAQRADARVLGSGRIRYDVLRGDVANLGPGVGSTIDLGPVVCVEDDSPDGSTAGSEDVPQPAPGHAFFYLYRGTNGLNYGPGSWGQGSAGGERTPGGSTCAP